MPYRPNFPIPSEIDPPRTCLCLPIPDSDEWRQVVAGLLTELTYWYNYERTGDSSGAQCALVWKEIFADIDWGNMSCGCCGEFDIIFRWTIDGVLESSTDDGETWEDASDQDPRNSSPVYPPPPTEGVDDPKCVAATGAVALIKEQIGDQLTDDMSRYTLGQLISNWVTTIIQTSNPFTAIITIITNQIFALVIATLRPALTDDVYNQLICILYCDMGDDISFNDAQWAQVRSDILAQISGIAGVFLEHLVYLLGKVGITNLARSQAATEGDCSDCGCGDGCNLDLWDIYSPDPNGYYGHIVSRDSGAGTITIETTNVNTNGFYYISIQTDADDHCCVFNFQTEDIGSAGAPAWGTCGSSRTSFSTGLIGDSRCVNALQWNSVAPFQVTITLSPCP